MLEKILMLLSLSGRTLGSYWFSRSLQISELREFTSIINGHEHHKEESIGLFFTNKEDGSLGVPKQKQ